MRRIHSGWWVIGLLATMSIAGSAHAVAAGSGPARPTSVAQKSFDEFTDGLAADWMRANPTSATSQQYFSGLEQDALDRELTAEDAQFGIPLEPAALAAFVQRARAGLDGLKRFQSAALTPVQRVSAGSLDWQLRDAIRMAELSDERFVFDQFRGLQVMLVNFLSQVHPVRSPRDVDNYLARLQRVAPAPAENVLVTSLVTREQKVSQIDQQARDSAAAAAEKTVRDSIRPAFQRVRDLLAGELPLATDDAGLWRLPKGAEAYAAALHINTTTDLSAQQIHELGLREVARISAEMGKQLDALGLTSGSVEERYKALEKSVQPAADPDPRPALLEDHARILRDAEQRAAALFDLRPTAPVQVLREPPFTEKNAAAHYSAPAPDGSRPGTVWIPLPGPEYGILEMRTLTYHEGVPGHHFQIALQQESTEIPVFRRKRVFGGLSAFAEGWALYAEQLAVESDWYRDDPKGRLGQLYDELFRARRLVVDTGLHAQHWTRQQAIDYGIPVAEVERYVVMPGQACAYKLGEREILAQRRRERDALGAAFSLKQFHDLLLRTGTVPLAVLSQVVDADIASKLKK